MLLYYLIGKSGNKRKRGQGWDPFKKYNNRFTQDCFLRKEFYFLQFFLHHNLCLSFFYFQKLSYTIGALVTLTKVLATFCGGFQIQIIEWFSLFIFCFSSVLLLATHNRTTETIDPVLKVTSNNHECFKEKEQFERLSCCSLVEGDVQLDQCFDLFNGKWYNHSREST